MLETYSESWRRHGERMSKDHAQWEFQARTLFHAASVCWQHYLIATDAVSRGELTDEVASDLCIAPTAGFLAAIGVEVLLKAIVLNRDPTLAHTAKTGFYSHDLLQIAQGLARLNINAEDAWLLSRLGQMIEWGGRYPTPRWDREDRRRDYDVISRRKDGYEFIEANDIPNAFNPDLWERTMTLVTQLYDSYRLASPSSDVVP